MIEFKDWELKDRYSVLARQYDDRSRQLLVGGELPDGWSWAMLVQVGDAMDIIALSPMEGGVGVVLTADQLSLSGYYRMQLRGTRGQEVRHTNVISVFIPASLAGGGQWPTVPSEFSQMEARLRDLNAHPPVPGGEGRWMLWDPDQGGYVDSEFPLPEGGAVLTGDGLKFVGGRLAVDTADRVEQDNTRPVTSAAVHMEIGNIEALLAAL